MFSKCFWRLLSKEKPKKLSDKICEYLLISGLMTIPFQMRLTIVLLKTKPLLPDLLLLGERGEGVNL